MDGSVRGIDQAVGRDGRSLAAAVIRVTSGNFLEMYDFMIYAYYATYIGRAYFPEKNAFASLMLSLGIFGGGFLMRPLGAIVLGAYIDHYGRRRGLIVTLGMMAVGLLLIAVTPSYATIGIAAPIIVVCGARRSRPVGRRGAWRRLRLPRRDRAAGPGWFLLLLAVG